MGKTKQLGNLVNVSFNTTTPLIGGGNIINGLTFSIAKSTTSVDGYLSSTDWNTFNNKQTALGFTPYNATNPAGYISSIIGLNISDLTNNSGYITSSALSPYAPLTTPTFITSITTPLINGSLGLLQFGSTDNVNIGNAATTGQRILRVGQGTGWVDFGNASDSAGIGFISFNQTTNTLANSALYGGAFSTILNSNNLVAIRLGNGNQIQVNVTNHVFTPSGSASGITPNFMFTIPANTNQTLSTNVPSFKVTGANKQWATGALATQYFNYFSANTVSFVGASTATNVFNCFIDAPTAGTNATVTNAFACGFGGQISLIQTVTSEVVVSDRTVTIVINGTTYKLLAKS